MAKRGRKPRTLDELYNTYLNEHRKLESKGVWVERPMTKNEYRSAYQAELNDRQDKVNRGERKTLGAINRDLAKQDAVISAQQAKQLERANRALGNTERWYDIRKDESVVNRIYNDISINYRQLKKLGLTGKEAGELIGRDFFGSM